MNSFNYYYNSKNDNVYIGCFVLPFEKPLLNFPTFYLYTENLAINGLKISDDKKIVFLFVTYEFEKKSDYSTKYIKEYLNNVKLELPDLNTQLFNKIKYENKFGKVLFKYKDGNKINLPCPKTLIEDVSLFKKK
jgi:hypothetical protein